MKKIVFGAITILASIATMVSCTSDMEYKDARVTAVNAFYEPANNKSVTLAASATAAVYFSWEPCRVEDSGSPLYEVVFFKPGETDPVYKMMADNNGAINHATILHKDMNKICKAAGFSQGKSGKVEWTVRSSRGLNEAQSPVRYTLSLTSIEGLDEIPNALFLTGPATEGGDDIAKAMQFASPELGVFEIFCRLEAGKTYRFVNSKKSDATTYYLDGTKVREGNGTSKVDQTAVYRIRLDLNVVSVDKFRPIMTMAMYFCPTNNTDFLMPYVGNGIFQGEGVISFKQEGWGRDERYKFVMVYADDQPVQMWGTKNGTDSRPGGLAPDNPYYHIKETSLNQWDDKWKFDEKYDGAADGPHPGVRTRLSVIFNVPNYTHVVELAK